MEINRETELSALLESISRSVGVLCWELASAVECSHFRICQWKFHHHIAKSTFTYAVPGNHLWQFLWKITWNACSSMRSFQTHFWEAVLTASSQVPCYTLFILPTKCRAAKQSVTGGLLVLEQCADSQTYLLNYLCTEWVRMSCGIVVVCLLTARSAYEYLKQPCHTATSRLRTCLSLSAASAVSSTVINWHNSRGP